MLLNIAASAQSWTNRFDVASPGFCDATALALDSFGNVYVTGSATGPNNNPDFATVAYSSSGTALWTNWYNGPGNAEDWGAAIAIGSNALYITGFSTDTNWITDFTTVAYTLSGTPLWTNSYDGGYGNNYGIGIAVGTNGDVFALAGC